MQVLPYFAFVCLWVALAGLVTRAAVAYRRPPGTWVLNSLFVGAPIALILLYIVGDPEDAAALQDKEERIRRRHPERTDIREAAMNEMRCPTCGADVNVVTGDGLHTAEDEPWLLFCDRCKGQIEPDV